MRRSILGAALGVAAMSLGIAGAPIEREAGPPAPPEPKKKRRPKKSKPSSWLGTHRLAGSIASENRHGGEHTHGREIARRKRQAEQRAQKE